MFNALKYTQELEKAGFTRAQAEISIRLLIDVMNENFATKSDLKTEFLSLRTELKAETKDLQSEIKELEYKMTIKLGTMMTIAIGVTAALVKMLPGAGH